MPYDYLVLALGRRLKTEQISGFFEHAHHLLGMHAAQKFGAAVSRFDKGRAIFGHCAGARLPVPVFETAFALSRMLKESNKRDNCTITIASNETPDEMFGGIPISEALKNSLEAHQIQIVSDFQISHITAGSLVAADGRELDFDLNMVIPPFGGPGPLVGTGLTDEEGYVRVDTTMQVQGVEGIYAAGDCVSFAGPKMGHMAIGQGEVVAENLAAEIAGKALSAHYNHEMTLVVDAGKNESVFVQKNLDSDDQAQIQSSRFWGWAKRKQEQYWKAAHA
jgi:sulfide:quinone oxidoreductase